MADGKLEIEKRVDRMELAIRTLAQQMVEKKKNYNEEDAQAIGRILEGSNEVERPGVGEVADQAPGDG